MSADQEFDMDSALQIVINKARVFDGLRRGLHECVKVLDRGDAKLCLLSSDCDNDEFTTLVEALCREHSIPLIKVDEREKLGTWVGLSKLATDGSVRKPVKCSVAVITDFGEESKALSFVQSNL